MGDGGRDHLVGENKWWQPPIVYIALFSSLVSQHYIYYGM